MQASILSLNIGVPQKMEWNGRSIMSSMLKTPVPGPLVVHPLSIDGDKFASPQFHGTPDSVLYAFGMKSLLEYMHTLGRDSYAPGALGENVTCDDLDETQISIGDVFSFGEVVVQVTFPRIPCGKVNLRMQHEDGQKHLELVGRSGIYFRILEPGKIYRTDIVKRIESAAAPYSLSVLYKQIVNKARISADEYAQMLRNGAFPKRFLEKTSAKIS